MRRKRRPVIVCALGMSLCGLLVGWAHAQVPGGQGTWTPKSMLSATRSEIVARAVNGKVYVLGGNYARTKYDLAVNEEFDPATGQSRERAPMPTGGNHLGAVVLDNKIYVIGGFSRGRHNGRTHKLQ